MTPTTDLQKPFTDEELRDWAKTGGFMQSRVAKRLAARVLELEAENKRLREGLKPFVEATINADIDRMESNDCLFDVTWPSRRGFTNRSILTIQNVRQARTALKGGEI
jgi:hypothetical protein